MWSPSNTGGCGITLWWWLLLVDGWASLPGRFVFLHLWFNGCEGLSLSFEMRWPSNLRACRISLWRCLLLEDGWALLLVRVIFLLLWCHGCEGMSLIFDMWWLRNLVRYPIHPWWCLLLVDRTSLSRRFIFKVITAACGVTSPPPFWRHLCCKLWRSLQRRLKVKSIFVVLLDEIRRWGGWRLRLRGGLHLPLPGESVSWALGWTWDEKQ